MSKPTGSAPDLTELESKPTKRSKTRSGTASDNSTESSPSESSPVKPKLKKKKVVSSSPRTNDSESPEGAEKSIVSEESAGGRKKKTAESSESENGKVAHTGMEKSRSRSKVRTQQGEDEAMFEQSGSRDASPRLVPNATSSGAIVLPLSDLEKKANSSDNTAEQVRSNLMSPLARVRATGRTRSGSSPARRESASQIRAQVQADTEKLARAGNATAKRILHRAKSESVVSMNSWDLGSTAGLRSTFTSNDQLLARAQAAATRRSKAPALQSRPSVLLLPDSYTPDISRDQVSENLLAPMRGPGAARKDAKRPRGSVPSISLPSGESETQDTSVTSSPKSPRSARRTLASFGRKTSYHSLGRTSSGILPSGLTPSASPATSTTDLSTGDKAKTHMEAFLRFASSHISDASLAEGIALMHSILVPSTYLFDHMQNLFKGEDHDPSLGALETLRQNIVNFIGSWVTWGPTDFVDDFVLEKKLKEWILGLQDSGEPSHTSYSLLLQNIVNQSILAVESLRGRTLTDSEVVDMAEAAKRGQVPGEAILMPTSTPSSLKLLSPDAIPSAKRPKSITIEEANRRASLSAQGKSPSVSREGSAEDLSVPSLRSASPSPPPPSPTPVEPSFENMMDLAMRVTSRELRSEAAAAPASSSPTLSKSSSNKAISPDSPSTSSSSSKTKEKDSSRSKSTPRETPRDLASSSDSLGQNFASADSDELSKRPKFSKKLLSHLSEYIGLKETPSLLNIGPIELAKQWTLLDHALMGTIRTHDMLLNVSKPSRSPILTELANRFNHATCWVALQILKIPNVKKRALAIAHMIAVAETTLNLTNLHGFIAIITGLSQHAISRLSLTWKKVDPAAKKTFEGLVQLASPIGNFKQLRSIHDNALPPFVPTPAMFLRDLLFVIEGNGGSFVQSSVVNTEMIMLCRKVLSRVQSSQQATYKFWGVDAIQKFITSGRVMTNEELDSLSEKVESGRDM